ncbi:MAG: aminopeptidase P family protein [Candidatus Aminicenantes bacterium]|nr:aminopeptidase P family protein [Candidatus Aminicenantes bacterium]
MSLQRRDFIKLSTAAAASAWMSTSCQKPEAPSPPAPPKPMTEGIVPITDEERLGRIEKARALMAENKLDAVLFESGSSLFYFTGVTWGLSERTFAWVLPARGETAWVVPKFEEERARELIRFGTDVRTWEEDESPYRVIAGIFGDRGIRAGTVGVEERLRFFIFDGVRREAPAHRYVSADPVTVGCRVIKSPAELALMQRANDITVEAYKAALPKLRAGMTKGEFSEAAAAAFRALGVSGGIGANFGEGTALPHGSVKPRTLREGDVVLMDGGCAVEGYRSDISRTVVFGKPTQRQLDVWNLEKEAQAAAFKAAGPGVPCEDVDAAARKVIVDAGYGPDYKVPGLPHRTGHGIGLDGHEWINLVRGNKTPMRPGMCFTNEPMIVIPGEFGVRLEDDMVITEDGARFFSQPSPAIDRPFV